jgi:hypothetical protein
MILDEEEMTPTDESISTLVSDLNSWELLFTVEEDQDHTVEQDQDPGVEEQDQS